MEAHDPDEFCDGACGNLLGAIRNMVEVEDGICFLCQRCFRVYLNSLMTTETKELYISGRLVHRRKRENGIGKLRLRQQATRQ